MQPQPPSRFLIVPLLEGAALEILNSLRKQWTPEGYRRAPAHITLIPPFYPNHSIDYILEKVGLLVRQEKLLPFQIGLGRPETSFLRSGIIVVAVEEDGRLTRLYESVIAALRDIIHFPDRSRLYPAYRPHITLARSKETTVHTAYGEEITRTCSDNELLVAGLAIWRMEEGVWHPFQEIPFKSDMIAPGR